MRQLTRDNFNTLATEAEITFTLAAMEARQHVNRDVVRDMMDGGSNHYALTLGKLYGLAANPLQENVTVLAARLGLMPQDIAHPKRGSDETDGTQDHEEKAQREQARAAKPRKPRKSTSRYGQLADLASEARSHLDALRGVLTEMEELRQGVQDWYDAMSEGWQQGESGQKAETIGGLDLDPDSALSDVEGALDELEGAL